MSPQPRRGRPQPAGHRKPQTHGSVEAAKPADATRPADAASGAAASEAAAITSKPTSGTARAAAKAAAAKRRTRPTGTHKYPALWTVGSYFKAYIPLFIGFLVLFGLIWGWTSFGPKAETTQQKWNAIEKTYLPQRDTAAAHISESLGDVPKMVAGYKEYANATRGWVKAIADVGDWSNPNFSTADNKQLNLDVQNLIDAGKAQADILDRAAAQSTGDQIIAMRADITTTDQTFSSYYGIAKSDIFPPVAGSPQATINPGPTIALPVAPSDSPAATDTPTPS